MLQNWHSNLAPNLELVLLSTTYQVHHLPNIVLHSAHVSGISLFNRSCYQCNLGLSMWGKSPLKNSVFIFLISLGCRQVDPNPSKWQSPSTVGHRVWCLPCINAEYKKFCTPFHFFLLKKSRFIIFTRKGAA